jgi:hypothetical protein
MVERNCDSDDDDGYDPNRYYEFTDEMRKAAQDIVSKEPQTSF